MSSTDWTTFNAKQAALGFTPYNATNPSGYTTNTGTVTSVAALTLGTTGTDVTSTVSNGSTTPVITLNLPTASASNRGALSAADWTTFNSKLGSYTETDTLATVTARGATANVPITVAGQIESTVTGFRFPDGTVQATAASGANWTKITTTTTATTKKQYVTDTTAGAFTVTLPASPAAGDYVYFIDAGNWATNNLTVARNGSTIEGSATNLIFDVAGLMIQLIYDGSTWQVMSNIGPQGPIGPTGPAVGVGKIIAMAMIFGG